MYGKRLQPRERQDSFRTPTLQPIQRLEESKRLQPLLFGPALSQQTTLPRPPPPPRPSEVVLRPEALELPLPALGRLQGGELPTIQVRHLNDPPIRRADAGEARAMQWVNTLEVP